MGYTIATPISDSASKKRMLSFLKKEFRAFPLLEGGSEEDPVYYRGPLGDDLSYDHGPCRIGFDFNCGGADRDYIFTVCRWIALKVGKTWKFPNKVKPNLSGSFPVIVYDGDEETEDPENGDGPWPVLLEGTPDISTELNWCFVDQYGCKSRFRKIGERGYLLDKLAKKNLKIIRPEMLRLDTEYRKKYLR